MPRFECPTCHGVYDDPQFGRFSYFHTCAPLSSFEKGQLTDAELARLVPHVPAFADAAAKTAFLEATTIERPGKRDENIRPDWRPRTLENGNSDPNDPPITIQGDPPRIVRGV